MTDKAGGQTIHGVRTSQSTNIPRDAVVRCIEARALAFQGFDVPAARLEPLQLVKYGAGERYHFHTDWFTDEAHATAALGGNRVSSFFAYVAVSDDIKGGGTNFPLVDAPLDERWCAFVDCDEPWDNGVTFRPVEGQRRVLGEPVARRHGRSADTARWAPGDCGREDWDEHMDAASAARR